MPAVKIILEVEGCWPDVPAYVRRGQLVELMGGSVPPLEMALLPGGVAAGGPSVLIRLDLPAGGIVLTETGLEDLENAVRAFRAYLEAREGPPPRSRPQPTLFPETHAAPARPGAYSKKGE